MPAARTSVRRAARRRAFALPPLALLAALAAAPGCTKTESVSEEVALDAAAPAARAPAEWESERYGRVTTPNGLKPGAEAMLGDNSESMDAAAPGMKMMMGGGMAPMPGNEPEGMMPGNEYENMMMGGMGGGSMGAMPADAAEAAPRRGAEAPPAADRPAFDALNPDPDPEFNTEEYDAVPENRFLAARQTPLSTFAVDVDTAGYANVRRFLNNGRLPPPGAVRIEELVNYFRYDLAPPAAGGENGDDRPFAVHAEVSACPWAAGHKLVRIGLKGRELAADARPRCNLVFLLDVSGSMSSSNKLGLVKRAMTLLVEQLGENDTVSAVVYAGASGLALPPTNGSDPRAILDALERLDAGGSTNGGEGIELAYATAQESYIPGGVNRVILCTDGDFNVGVTDQSSLVRLIEQKAKAGVSLTVLGFGTGNYNDATMEELSNRGDGNYGYVDDMREARKLLVEDLTGTLVTIAKDVKIQVEFNPAAVGSYRLIGYENRLMAAEDFRDDEKDAGEIGAGHTVTALYEVVPAGADEPVPGAGELKYQAPGGPTDAAAGGELLTVSLRYKAPDAAKADPAAEFAVPVPDAATPFEEASADQRFAAAVAAFGMLLRGGEHAGTATLADADAWADAARGPDPGGYRAEFAELAARAVRLGD